MLTYIYIIQPLFINAWSYINKNQNNKFIVNRLKYISKEYKQHSLNYKTLKCGRMSRVMMNKYRAVMMMMMMIAFSIERMHS